MNKFGYKSTNNLNAKDTSILLFSIAAVIKAIATLIDSTSKLFEVSKKDDFDEYRKKKKKIR